MALMAKGPSSTVGVCYHAGCVHALFVTITSANGASLGPVKLSNAPQPCFTQSSCDIFYATASCKLGTLEEAKVSMSHPDE